MRHFYSPSQKGFYNDHWFALDKIPSDAVEIPEEYHGVLIGGQSTGKVIVHDETGAPYLIDPPKTHSQEHLEQNFKAMADARLKDTDWTQQMDVSESLENYQEFVDYRKAIRDIRALESYTDQVWPELPKPIYKKG